MDPLGLSASVAGLLSLALEVTKILNGYIGGVVSAPQEALELNTEITALHHVLRSIIDVLRKEDIENETVTFDRQSIMCSVISACESHIKIWCKRLAKLQSFDMMARLTWPFKKD
jgi:hypothetical protein